MISTLFAVLVLLVSLVAVIAGFAAARRFVRTRLRYVPAAQRRSAPVIAGAGALLLGAVAALILPFVGAFTALSFAAAVALGVSAGAKDIRRGAYWVTGGV